MYFFCIPASSLQCPEGYRRGDGDGHGHGGGGSAQRVHPGPGRRRPRQPHHEGGERGRQGQPLPGLGEQLLSPPPPPLSPRSRCLHDHDLVGSVNNSINSSAMLII